MTMTNAMVKQDHSELFLNQYFVMFIYIQLSVPFYNPNWYPFQIINSLTLALVLYYECHGNNYISHHRTNGKLYKNIINIENKDKSCP